MQYSARAKFLLQEGWKSRLSFLCLITFMTQRDQQLFTHLVLFLQAGCPPCLLVGWCFQDRLSHISADYSSIFIKLLSFLYLYLH